MSTTAAIHPSSAALPRGQALAPGNLPTYDARDEGLTKPQPPPVQQPEQAQQQPPPGRWTKEAFFANLKQTYDQAKTRASVVVPESVKTQDWSGSVKHAYDGAKNRVAMSIPPSLKENEQLNKFSTAVNNNLQNAKARLSDLTTPKENDPHHGKEMWDQLKDSWNELHTWWSKVFLVGFFLLHFFVFALPQIFLNKIGIRSNRSIARYRLKRVTTTPRIWLAEYVMPIGETQSLIIQGNDGGLFIRSPPEPTPQIVEAIRAEGEPTAIFLTMSHDTFGDKWKELFPNVKVLAMRQDIAGINNRVKVDFALEEATDILQNFHIERIINTAEWSRTEESVLILDLGNGKKAASFGCGFAHSPALMTNWSPLAWRNWLIGMEGLGAMNIFVYLLARHDFAKLQQIWNSVAEVPGLETLLFLHGEPIVNNPDIKSLMLNHSNLPKLWKLH